MTCRFHDKKPCPECGDMNTYAPTVYNKDFEQILKEVTSAMNSETVDLKETRLLCLFSSMCDLLRHLIEEENEPIQSELKRMREMS